MNWKSYMGIGLCVITFFCYGCGNKSNESSSSTSTSSTQLEELKKEAKEMEKKADIAKATPDIKIWGDNICALHSDVGEQWDYWWPQALGLRVSNFKAVQTLNINVGQYHNSLISGSGKIPDDIPEDIKKKMQYVHDELDKSMSITEDLTAKWADIIKEGQPLRSGQSKLIQTMKKDIFEHRANAISKLKEIYSDIGADMPEFYTDNSTENDKLNISEGQDDANEDGRVTVKY